MPLLMCPNDNAAMTTVERAGVQFDMCPACRGVWLDRGELEKLMAASRDEAAPIAAGPPPSAWREPRPDYRPEPRFERRPDHRRYDDDDDDHRRHGHHRKKRFDLFDIFD
jgi:Zn-finger nucleic acid-binding protein